MISNPFNPYACTLKSYLTSRPIGYVPLLRFEGTDTLISVYWPDNRQKPIFKFKDNMKADEAKKVVEYLPAIMESYEEEE